MKTKTPFLDTIFRHHSWFVGGNKTKAEALDYFAECGDFRLDKREDKKQYKEENFSLLSPIVYDDVLYYIGKEKGFYRLTEEEKIYFLERKNHHSKIKEEKYLQWINEEKLLSDFIKEDFKNTSFINYFGCNSHYNEIQSAKKREDKESEKYHIKRYFDKKQNFITIAKFAKNNEKTLKRQDYKIIAEQLKSELLT